MPSAEVAAEQSAMKHGQTAVFTICSRNYLALARTLLQSVRNVHPDWSPFLLLVDEVEGGFDPASEPAEVILASDLDIPEPKKFFFRYNTLEANTAVKPWMFDYLFAKRGVRRAIYLDPDIRVYRPLAEVERLMDEGALMVLTPHLLKRVDDDHYPNETHMLQSGAYNLGFLAVADKPMRLAFLAWWKARLERLCVSSVAEGLFVDQKWMDLAPSFFEGIRILRDEGYNVAYWNLAARPISRRPDGWWAGERPLVFFHFSGLPIDQPANLSRYQNRHVLRPGEPAMTLVLDCLAEWRRNGLDQTRALPYAYACFADGQRIPDFVRRAYRGDLELRRKLGADPFRAFQSAEPPTPDEFPYFVRACIKRLWSERGDLQKAFPDIEAQDRFRFACWWVEYGRREHELPDAMVNPIMDWIHRNMPKPPEPAPRRMARLGKRPASPKPAVDPAPAESPPASTPPPGRPARPLKIDGRLEGVNLVGYVRAETGVGESVRQAAKALTAVDVPFCMIDFSPRWCGPNRDDSWKDRLSRYAPYNASVLHMNAEEMMFAYSRLGDDLFAGEYCVGVWAWELPVFPARWTAAFQYFDEIWAASRFIASSIEAVAPIPVTWMPHSVAVAVDPRLGRPHFGLPSDRFIFLSMYDVNSYQARKNPIGAIDAFKKAFPPDAPNAMLVVKVNHPEWNSADVSQLEAAIHGWPNIRLLAATVTRPEINALINASDCLVSLHRSEGFGLPLAEAMALGRVALGTGYSGNMDFMREDNSCLVPFRMVPVGQDCGPYEAWQQWADPDIDYAASAMRRLVEDEPWRRAIAARGQETIEREFSPLAAGRRMARRLSELGLLKGTAPLVG